MKQLLSVLVLAVLTLLPRLGEPAPLAVMDGFAKRLITPISPGELAELEFLSCLRHFSEEIPAGRDVQILFSQNDWLNQRTQERLYPRLRLVNSNPEYYFVVQPQEQLQTLVGTIQSKAVCSGIVLEVRSND